jgi:hypothetical protein
MVNSEPSKVSIQLLTDLRPVVPVILDLEIFLRVLVVLQRKAPILNPPTNHLIQAFLQRRAFEIVVLPML